MITTSTRAAVLVFVFALVPTFAGTPTTGLATRLAGGEGDLALTGRALASGAVPLPEADVQLLPLATEADSVRATLAGTTPEPAARSKTDASGRFRLVAPAPGAWLVRIESAGRVAVVTTPLLVVDAQDLGDAELAPDQGLVVTVAAGGRPLRGALVQAVRTVAGPARRLGVWSRATQLVLSGADGSARIARAAGEAVRVVVSATGYSPAMAGPARGAALTLALERGTDVPLVVTRDAAPAAGALVAWDDPLHPLALTDAEGRATITLPADAPRTRLVLVAQDGAHATATIARPQPDRPIEPVRVALAAPRSMSGAVLDLETRRPIAGAIVYDERDPRRTARTGADGRFTLVAGGAGALTATAVARGYVPSMLDDRAPGTVATFALRAAAAIEGTVVSSAGEPVAGAEVSATAALALPRAGTRDIRILRGGPPRAQRVVTAADGRFRIGGLDPDKTFELTTRAEGYAPGKLQVSGLAPRRTRGGQTIRLARGASASVVVVDEDGQPIANAEVRLRAGAQAESARVTRMIGGPEPEPARALTDRDGRASFEHLASGRYEVEAVHTGFARAVLPASEVAEGRPADLGRIVLEPGVTLEGLVVDADGQPVEGAEIGVETSGGRRFGFPVVTRTPDAASGSDGRFAVYDRKRGEQVDLEVRHEGYAPASTGSIALPPAEPVKVVLRPSATLQGRVADAEGHPIAGASLALKREARGGGGPVMMVGVIMQLDVAGDDGTSPSRTFRPAASRCASRRRGGRTASCPRSRSRPEGFPRSSTCASSRAPSSKGGSCSRTGRPRSARGSRP